MGELYTRACERDRKAAEALVSQLTPMVLATVRTAGVHPDSLEDVASSVWLKLFDYCGRIKNPEAVAGWLRTTARNQSMDWHRDRARHTSMVRRALPEVDSDDPGFELVEEADELSGRKSIMLRALAKMDQRCRRLIALKAQEPKLKNREIAELLEIPIGSVGPTHGRCLAKLRELLSQEAAA